MSSLQQNQFKSCSRCTFLNKLDAVECEMCGGIFEDFQQIATAATSSSNDSDDEMMDFTEFDQGDDASLTERINSKKRKRENTQNSDTAKRKKQKMSKDFKQIEKAYQKFLCCYVKVSYAQRTICIEFGPNFTGRSKAFHQILSDTAWRPKSLKQEIPENVAYDHCDNPTLPPFVARIKSHRINTDKNLIFPDADNEQSIALLKGLKLDGLAKYFLPKLLDKTKAIYADWIMLRLDFVNFCRIWNEKGFDGMLSKVKKLENVRIICVVLEGMSASNVSKKECAFADVEHLKDAMMKYHFYDNRLHFIYKRNQRETAEYLVRSARSLADHRFKKKEVNQLNVANQSRKVIRAEKGKSSEKDSFVGSLLNIHNLSESKAMGIINKYPQKGLLMKAYSAIVLAHILLGFITLPELSTQNLTQNHSKYSQYNFEQKHVYIHASTLTNHKTEEFDLFYKNITDAITHSINPIIPYRATPESSSVPIGAGV